MLRMGSVAFLAGLVSFFIYNVASFRRPNQPSASIYRICRKTKIEEDEEYDGKNILHVRKINVTQHES
jgi:hypothetical protein